MNRIVGVSDAAASDDMEDVLITYSLGSCIGVALYDPYAHVGGLLHFQLPNAATAPDRAKEKPLMFGDTGMDLLLERMMHMGAIKRRLWVKVAGGARMLNDSTLFDIGRRNHASIRKILWQGGMLISGEHVGGKQARNMELRMADGSVLIKCDGEQIAL